MNNLNDCVLNATVEYLQGSINTTLDSNKVGYYNYYECWYRPYYYSEYYPIILERSKVELAFKIIGGLIEKKIIDKKLTVKEFIELTNEIAKII